LLALLLDGPYGREKNAPIESVNEPQMRLCVARRGFVLLVVILLR